MKTIRRIILSVIPFLLVATVLLLQPERKQTSVAPAGRAPAGTLAQTDDPGRPAGGDVYVGEPVTPGLSPAVRDLPPASFEPRLDREINPRQAPLLDLPLGEVEEESGPDPLLARAPANPGASPAPLQTFEGLSIQQGTGIPPDTIGEVGPNHYVQMVNVAFAVYGKGGSLLSGPTFFYKLFEGNVQTPHCAATNDGDPVVIYDALADRWLLSQFFGYGQAESGLCMAVSTTPDPAGDYYLYEFLTPVFPDYFKIGLWPDGYYVSANESGSGYAAYVFDRASMLDGDPAGSQRFGGETNFLMPADLDGATPPPAGSPGYFYTFKDNVYFGGNDRLEIFALDVDWNNSNNTSFTRVNTIGVTPFTYSVCGPFQFDCIPQLGTSQRVDAISEWPMWRLQYRNFGAYETLVGNFTVDTGGDRAGIRWFELRNSGSGWTLHQEGTQAPPDGHHRWLGSIAMDGKGNMALGYSASSGTLYPSIRYATRLAGDPQGTFQSEVILQSGGGSQTTYNRWGDYSALVVDPADDCTFWYTNEYFPSTGVSWHTRVGTFRVPGCLQTAAADLAVSVADSPDPVEAGQPLTYTVKVENKSTLTATNVSLASELAPETTLASFEPAGLCTDGGDSVDCALGTLPGESEIAVTIVVTVEAGTAPGEIVSRSTVSADEPDPDAGNNEAVEQTLVAGYGVALAPPRLSPTTAGNALSYPVAITNTGNVPDTFDLSISGQVWTTTLGVAEVTLQPGQTTLFNIDVEVPPAAASGDMDEVTVEARSRADAGVSATTTITTVVANLVYLPAIQR